MRIKQVNLRVLLFSLLVFASSFAIGQVKTVTGKVFDLQNGEPLPGVSILVKGTTIGTTTNLDGEYSISTEQGKTLVFSFIGYLNEEV